ncbi:MAG: hypothetical protein R2713_23140 [Ilumatobacteraceae bacterium]
MVLTGAPPAFCAGADLTGVESGEFVDALVTVLAGFTQLPMVTIAAVDGPRSAPGRSSRSHAICAWRHRRARSASPRPSSASRSTAGRSTGSPPSSASVARSMLLAARPPPPSSCTSPERSTASVGSPTALVWADELAHLAPLTIRAHKLGLEADERFEAARVAAWASADAEEGRLAFLEKRPPVFRAE